MSRTYRVALIGCGKRARAHLPGLQADERVKVVALVDANLEAAQAMNADGGFDAPLYTDYRQMLEKEKPEVVVACLWTPLHLPVFRDCAAAGVRAVLSEKPMAPTWGDCCEMAAIAEKTGCQLTFCHQRRFARGNRLVRQWIREGRLGTIERMDLYSPPNLLDCGTHTIDQAVSFLGEQPVKWVLGAIDASKPIRWFDVSAEAMATGTLVFANGVRAHLQTGGPDMDLWGGVRVVGSEGFLEVMWDGQIRRGRLYDNPAFKPPTAESTHDEHITGVIRDALDCLESGAEPELGYRKALRTSEVIFAFYESVRRHARVELPLTDVLDNPFLTLLDGGHFPGAVEPAPRVVKTAAK